MIRSRAITPTDRVVTHDDNCHQAIDQSFVLVEEGAKEAALTEIMEGLPAEASVVVFCNTKARCESLCLSRRRAGASAVAIHGDKDQYEREVALRVFTRGSARFLFATDVAARGLDVKGITHVINFDMPQVVIA